MNKKKANFLKKKKLQISWFSKILNNKRQKFVASVIVLAFALFFYENFFGRFNIIFLIALSFTTALFFFLSTYQDSKHNFSPQLLILPFLYTFSFGLFFSLVPARFLTRSLITIFYSIGLYSLFLSQNIFIISSMKTITLLSSARIVSFVLTLISYFFIINIIFSLHLSMLPVSALVFIASFLFIRHSLWTHTLNKPFLSEISWVLIMSFFLFEISLVLAFWPSNPTLIALFLTGLFYTIVGLTQVWFDKRLFKGVIWEYVWVAVIVFFIMVLFTPWK